MASLNETGLIHLTANVLLKFFLGCVSPSVGSQISSQICAMSLKDSVSVAFLLVPVLCQKISLSLGDFRTDKKVAWEFTYCILHLGVAPSRIKMTQLVVSRLLISSFQIPVDSDQKPWHAEDALARGCFPLSSFLRKISFLYFGAERKMVAGAVQLAAGGQDWPLGLVVPSSHVQACRLWEQCR